MKKIFSVIGLTALCSLMIAQERIELLPFGDFDQWAVRYIKESKMIGGKTKTLYAVAPVDTIRQNAAFEYGKDGNIWSVSNAYAKVAGIEKASGTTYPERRDKGWCVRMDSNLEEVSALGIIDLKVLVSGTIFTGRTIEPIGMKGTSDPYGCIDFGVPFTGHPVAMMLDYKAIVENSNVITYAKATSSPKKKEGHDCAQLYIILQHRWEDENGNVYARRIGTGFYRIESTVSEWQNNFRIPIRYGDITLQAGYKAYEGLNQHNFKAMNKYGKIVPIQEQGYGLEAPTHMVIMLTSGCYGAFVGHEGNSLWVDNVRLVYDEE